MAKPLLFLSFDIEADGEAPGLNSMLSIGFVGFNEKGLVVMEYEANLQTLAGATQSPQTMKWWHDEKQKEAWDYVNTNKREPDEVFKELCAKLDALAKEYKVVPVAWPCNYDWQWINYYFHRFCNRNPLGFSAICMKSYLWAMSKNASPSQRMDLSRFEDKSLKHTHKALDDAKEQGSMFIKAWMENTYKSNNPTIKGDKPLNNFYKNILESGLVHWSTLEVFGNRLGFHEKSKGAGDVFKDSAFCEAWHQPLTHERSLKLLKLFTGPKERWQEAFKKAEFTKEEVCDLIFHFPPMMLEWITSQVEATDNPEQIILKK